MKENLKLKLDMLQAQLSRVNEQEDGANGKMFRTRFVIEKQPVHDVEDPVVLEKEINATKRALADRKIHHAVTVVQRLLKSWKQVEVMRLSKRIKRDASRAAKLEEELNVIKECDAAIVSRDFVLRTIIKRAEPGIVEGYEKRSLSPAESNIYGRFGKTQTVREAIDTLIRNLSEWFETSGHSNASKVDAELPEHMEVQEKLGDASKQQHGQEKPLDRASSQEHSINEPVPLAREDDPEEDSEPGEDPFFEQGLPALTQGYISGSEDEEDIQLAEPKEGRKNRRGQRARRRIWELKYGKRANHILKEQREREELQRQKEERQRLRELRDRKRQRESKRLAEMPLHPSWQAKREEEARRLAKFAGTKRKFED